MTTDDPRMQFPYAVEDLLAKAARDPAFREILLRDRDAAIAASGVELTEAEIAVLRAASRTQLESTIDELAASSFLRGFHQEETTAGIRPDRPIPPVPQSLGIRPDRGFFRRLFKKK